MKKRSLLIMSFALALMLVVGGTLAWFTADAEVLNQFKAGTLKINVEEDFDEEAAGNVNPGDTIKKEVEIENTGTKRAYLRGLLEPEWNIEGIEFDEDIDVEALLASLVDYVVEPGWIQHTDGYFYYTSIVQLEEKVKFLKEVKFAGAEMPNELQGAEFKLNVKIEAIQVTNGAALDEWGIDPSTLAPTP